MEAMRKEIARVNEIIGKGCLDGKAQASEMKTNDPKGPQFKQGIHPSIKHGLGHTAGAKTNGRKIINGYECVKFERKERVGIDQPAQTAAVPLPAKMGRLPILLLIKLSSRRRCPSRSQRIQCGYYEQVCLPTKVSTTSTKLDFMFCFKE